MRVNLAVDHANIQIQPRINLDLNVISALAMSAMSMSMPWGHGSVHEGEALGEACPPPLAAPRCFFGDVLS